MSGHVVISEWRIAGSYTWSCHPLITHSLIWRAWVSSLEIYCSQFLSVCVFGYAQTIILNSVEPWLNQLYLYMGQGSQPFLFLAIGQHLRFSQPTLFIAVFWHQEGLGTPITWMMFGGGEVDVGGRGPHSNNILDFIIERSNDSQDSWGSQDWQYLTSPVRISLYRLLHASWLMDNAPHTSTLHPPNIIHMMCVPRPSSFFTLFRFRVYYTERKPKNKKRGRPGNEATHSGIVSLVYWVSTTVSFPGLPHLYSSVSKWGRQNGGDLEMRLRAPVNLLTLTPQCTAFS